LQASSSASKSKIIAEVDINGALPAARNNLTRSATHEEVLILIEIIKSSHPEATVHSVVFYVYTLYNLRVLGSHLKHLIHSSIHDQTTGHKLINV